MTSPESTQGSAGARRASGSAARRRPSWWSLRGELPAGRRRLLILLSFTLPLLAWSAVSYIPFLWHPDVLVTDAGDASVAGEHDYLSTGMLVGREAFAARNAELAAAGARPARGTRANPIYLPAPHEVACAFYTAFKTPPARQGDLWLHESLLHSCRVIFWGFILSVIFGLPLGILCGSFAVIARLAEPFTDFVRYMPAPVFGALAVAIWGLDDAPKVAVIFIGTFFQLVLVTANTTRLVDGGLLEAAQTLGCSRWQLLRHVVVPAALPGLYRDLRILLGWAWTYLVVAELIGAKSGISAFLYQAQRYKQFDNVYAAMLMIGMIGLACDQILAILGKGLFPWERRGGNGRRRGPFGIGRARTRGAGETSEATA